MNLETTLDHIQTGKLEIDEYSSGLKNTVGLIKEKGHSTGKVIKIFRGAKANDVADFYGTEKAVYHATEQCQQTPQLIDYDDQQRILIISEVPGQDLYKNEIHTTSQLPENSALIAESIHRFRQGINTKKITQLRVINLEAYIPNGLEALEKEGFLKATKELAYLSRELEKAIATDSTETICHGSLNPGNIILSPQRITFIDFELAGTGKELYDISFLLSRNSMTTAEKQKLMDEYLAEAHKDKKEGQIRIDMYSLASTVLLLGLDYEQRNHMPRVKKRFEHNLRQLNSRLSNNTLTNAFVQEFYRGIQL